MPTLNINGHNMSVEAANDSPLLWAIREQLQMTGTKFGCGAGLCGACTVSVDGKATRSCRTPLQAVEGKQVLTIEGLATGQQLHPLQAAFVEHGAFQCGYCTPGMIMNAHGLLLEKPRPSRQEIAAAMEDNLCRCGAHARILAAIEAASRAGGRS